MNFEDAEVPFFLSYCNFDNGSPKDWVTEFFNDLTDAFKHQLGKRFPDKPPFFQDNTPITSGTLTNALKRAIDSSFALVIVAGRNYPDSDICLQEIKWFLAKNSEIRRNRLFFVVKEKGARELLLEKMNNKGYVNERQVLAEITAVDFYSNERNLGLSTKSDRDCYNKLLASMAEDYDDWCSNSPKAKQNNADSSQPTPSHANAPNALQRIVIGPSTNDIESAVGPWYKKLAEKLAGHIELVRMSESDLADSIVAMGKLKGASCLVLPVGFEQINFNIVEGGHLKILKDLWLKTDSTLLDLYYVRFGEPPDEWPPMLELSKEYLSEIYEKSFTPDNLPACLTPPKNTQLRNVVVIDQQGPFGASVESWLTQREERVSIEPIDLRAIAGVEFKPNVSDGYRTHTQKRAKEAFEKAVFVLALRSDQNEPYDTCSSVLESIWRQLTVIRGPSWPRDLKFFAAVIKPPIGGDEVHIGRVKAFQFTSCSDGRLEPANPETEKILLDELRKVLEPRNVSTSNVIPMENVLRAAS